MQDVPQMLRNSARLYQQAIAILNAQGITENSPDWSERNGGNGL